MSRSAFLSSEVGRFTSVAEYLLDATCAYSPIIEEAISTFGDCALSEYLEQILPVPNDSFQGRDDLLNGVFEYAAPLLGGDVADRMCGELNASPVVLTTNHHGVDFFSQSVQGNLIFSLRSIGGNPATTVPVFSCGGIPLDNFTYPQGLLVYDVGGLELDKLPKKFPIFSNKSRRKIVSVVGPIDEEMVRRAQQRFIKMVAQGEFSESSLAVIERILMEDYSAPEVTDLRTYSDQSVAINHRIWKRLLANHEAIPDVAYLELEKIVSKLLEKDLVNPGSLAGSVMFDPELRRCILTELDGARVCWETKKLAERLLMDSAPGGQCKDSNRGGTVFFWGISNALRKVPLYLTTSDTAGDVLQGIDDKGHRFEWPFNSHSVLQGLRAKRLIPSLFTSFLTLSFARGVTCLGGYYQAEYLPAIQDGVVRALRRFYNYRHAADCVTKVHTRAYLGGMQAVMRRIDREHLVPAGPLEIIASGGLTTEELRLIRSLTVRDAHIASLFETITELGLASIAPNDWKRQLAEVCNGILRDQIVIK